LWWVVGHRVPRRARRGNLASPDGAFERAAAISRRREARSSAPAIDRRPAVAARSASAPAIAGTASAAGKPYACASEPATPAPMATPATVPLASNVITVAIRAGGAIRSATAYAVTRTGATATPRTSIAIAATATPRIASSPNAPANSRAAKADSRRSSVNRPGNQAVARPAVALPTPSTE
jgi:hypothetical protein